MHTKKLERRCFCTTIGPSLPLHHYGLQLSSCGDWPQYLNEATEIFTFEIWYDNDKYIQVKVKRNSKPFILNSNM